MWQYYMIPAVLNAPEFLRTGDIGTYGKNVAVSGSVNAATGGIGPDFGVGGAAPVGSNINPALIGNKSLSQGITSNITNQSANLGAGSLFSNTGNTIANNVGTGFNAGNLAQQNIVPTTQSQFIGDIHRGNATAPFNMQNDKSMMQTLNRVNNNPLQQDIVPTTKSAYVGGIHTSDPRNIGGGVDSTLDTSVRDINNQGRQIMPRYKEITKSTAEEIANRTGGEEPAGAGITGVFKKLTDYYKDKPFEATMMTMLAGGAAIDAFNPPEGPTPQPTLGPSISGGKPNFTPFKMRRG